MGLYFRRQAEFPVRVAGRGPRVWGHPDTWWGYQGEALPSSFCAYTVLDPGALNLKKEGTQMPGVNYLRMPVSVSPATEDQALPYDSLTPPVGCRHSNSLPFKAGETETQ